MNDPKNYPVAKTGLPLIRSIDEAVDEAKMNDDWRHAFMIYQIHQMDAEKRGIAIGEERGITIGEKRGKLETARAMLKELPIDQVARFTGLSREELQSLAGEIAPQG